jgi:uncharacterized membrane protein
VPLPCGTRHPHRRRTLPSHARPGASQLAIAAIFIVAGLLHLVVPSPYEGIMPPWLPYPRELVLLSGVFQIAGGLGVLHPRTRRAAGWGLILLLLAVWPANVQMLLDARASGAPAAVQALLALRIPLQIPLIWWVWRSCVRSAVIPRAHG